MDQYRILRTDANTEFIQQHVPARYLYGDTVCLSCLLRDETCAACMILRKVSPSGRRYRLEWVCTDPEYRGRGLAGALLDYLCDQVETHRLRIDVSYADSPVMDHLLYSYGFDQWLCYMPEYEIDWSDFEEILYMKLTGRRKTSGSDELSAVSLAGISGRALGNFMDSAEKRKAAPSPQQLSEADAELSIAVLSAGRIEALLLAAARENGVLEILYIWNGSGRIRTIRELFLQELYLIEGLPLQPDTVLFVSAAPSVKRMIRHLFPEAQSRELPVSMAALRAD